MRGGRRGERGERGEREEELVGDSCGVEETGERGREG